MDKQFKFFRGGLYNNIYLNEYFVLHSFSWISIDI